MTVVRGQEPNNIFDLLADEATVGLSEPDRALLDGLLSEHPGLDVESFHRAAAAIDVAVMADPEPMPAGLKARLTKLGAEIATGPVDPASGSVSSGGGASFSGDDDPRAGTGGFGLMLWSGWLAAAATIVIAVSINLKSTAFDERIDRERLIAGGAVVLQWSDWADTETPGVSGDVVWDESEQAGYMRFVGLPANDPDVQQYQLWIIDQRGMEQRVNGGVFDSPGPGEVIVPIRPGLQIDGAAAFAVTIEAPDGVAVSDMSRKSLIAGL